jgi:hypothetical protein
MMGTVWLPEKTICTVMQWKACVYCAGFFLFARHGGQTQPAERRCHPDQGEDNPNRKGVAGNGRV